MHRLRTQWTRLLHVDLLGSAPACTAGPIAVPAAAPAHRRVDDLVAALQSSGRTVRSAVRRVWSGYVERRRIGTLRAELRSLDDCMLHDLGLSRCEIDSVVAELTREAPPTRRQVPARIGEAFAGEAP